MAKTSGVSRSADGGGGAATPPVVRPTFGQPRVISEAEVIPVGRLVEAATGSARRVDAPPLAGRVALWLAIGAGNTGKSFFCRWFGDHVQEQGREWTIGALDAGGRTLMRFFQGAHQPMVPSLHDPSQMVESRDPAVMATWFGQLVEAEMEAPFWALVDTGGNDSVLPAQIEQTPDLIEVLEASGVAVVAAFFLSPRVEDLDPLATLLSLGFAPKNMLLICNTGTASAAMNPALAFAPVRQHPAYRDAVSRGAVELTMPRLWPDVEQLVALRSLHFSEARDGVVRSGRQVEPIGGLNRSRVRRWMAEMEEMVEPVREWMGLPR
jgi:hypothetical protein